MGVGALAGQQKAIFIEYKNRVYKIIFSRSATNVELQDLIRSATDTINYSKITIKDSQNNVHQITASIQSNTIEEPYKLEAFDPTFQNGNSNGYHEIKNHDSREQDTINEMMKEIYKVIKFEDSKKELLDKISHLEKKVDAENLKLVEVEMCRKEIKDLKEMIQSTTVKNKIEKEDYKQKLILSNIPTYPKYQLSPETIDYLKQPTFNIWHWESNEMLSLLEHMYYELELVSEFNMNPIILKRWLLCIQANYRNNPFHNFRHCFCVAQMCYGLIHLCDFKKVMSKIDLVILLTAAICHDLDHPGYNNAYQINAKTELAIRYNDISPLENHHCAVAFQILSNPSCNIFSNVSEETFKEIRNGMVKLILGTDMAKHKELLEELLKYVPNFDFKNSSHMEALKTVIIKCCDISNEVRPTEISEPWLDCLLEEYFMQSDREKLEGLPVAPFMDRDKVTKPNAQVGFIKFVLIPMFECVAKIFPQITDVMVKPLYESFDRYQKMKIDEERQKNDSA